MVPRETALAAVMAGLLVLAGCGGPFLGDAGPSNSASPTPDATPLPTADGSETAPEPTETTSPTTSGTVSPSSTESPTPDATVRVIEGEIDVDTPRVFGRLQRLLDTAVDPPTVEIRDLTERKGYDPTRSPLFAALGFDEASFDPDAPGGVTVTSGKVYLHPAKGDPSAIRRVLVHEFVHTAQFRGDMLPWLSALDQPRLTIDRVQTRLMLLEGGAVYVTDEYLNRHHPNAKRQSAVIAERFRAGSPSERLFWARYRFGQRFVADRIDDPSALGEVYENRPTTSEQVLDNRTPATEPEANLTLQLNNDEPGWTTTGNDTLGELVLRMALETELNRSRAMAAADGWGTDQIYGIRNGSRWAWAWVTRWDSSGDADEFEAAARTYADRRAQDSAHALSVSRVAPDTVLMALGEPGMVTTVSASGTTGNVTVSVG